MTKITFMGAGSTIFAKNVLGDVLTSDILNTSDIRLYDIDETRLEESYILLTTLNKNINNGRARITKHIGIANRKEALKEADFVVNAIQVGGYDPATIIDFEIPKKYGLKQTIADTLGIGGIMRGLRTIPVMEAFANDMEEVCPNAWLLNYTNPMAILTGYMQRYTKIKTIGLCHSVQTCSRDLLKDLDLEDKLEGRKEVIAGINHMAWLLSIKEKEGNDLYPEIKKRAFEKNKEKHHDMVRYDYIDKFGYYCTESSEHNAEYNPYYIKSNYPQLIDKFNIPLDEYPRRCVDQIERWDAQKKEIMAGGQVSHERSEEYACHIMESIVTDTPYQIGASVINNGLISNLPDDACVEVPCLVNGSGIHPCHVGKLPTQLAALNMTNINPQLLTIEAALTRDRQKIYQAAMLDPHTAAELSLDDIVKLCDELIQAHGDYMKMY
ncbi:alpha-glucosidase/alpha-galactosidase [Acidaminobacter sp. JC074]|uniref:alpha-glucosidase/alpha-galactosidase n=1 Tax=Acidaminobacter sp. JC074 TaxID=2530199 RepID=UPI001F0F5356|nr:alpha-glucosidase/alpha-galactosidase [Acidaminobacter sp. JC074]MCH4886516.1 alpha-glucosidase/alpha-galactosidase [Acidaminobacter sp. JC074]